ncbi:MAG: MinD/ParA family protein [Gammaproteobacteria bacterium]
MNHNNLNHLRQANRPTRVIAVTSGKGGVGKSTVSINLGVALAELGQQVMLLDADLGLANVDVLLGLTPRHTLGDVVDGTCELDDVVVEGPAGLSVIPAASGVQHMAELSEFERAGLIHAFGALERRVDVMIVDTAAGIAANTLDFCTASHEVLVVVCDDPASITDAYASIKVMSQQAGRNRFRVLVNMAAEEQTGLRLYARLLEVTDRYLDVSLDYAGQIPLDAAVAGAARRRRAVVETSPDGPAGRAFKNLALTADNWPVPASASGRIEFFVERMARSGSFGRVAQL